MLVTNEHTSEHFGIIVNVINTTPTTISPMLYGAIKGDSAFMCSIKIKAMILNIYRTDKETLKHKEIIIASIRHNKTPQK